MITNAKATSLASRFNALNARIESFMPVLTPSSVLLGILFSSTLIQLKPFVPWFFALMTLSGSLKLRVRDLGTVVTNPLPVFTFFLSAHVLMPLTALGVSRIFLPGDADTTSGFVLLFATPTAVSAFIWVAMFNGDGALALAIILLDTIVSPFVVPFTTSVLLGADITMDTSAMATSLIQMIVAPTILGVALHEFTRGAAPKMAGPFLGPISKLCIIVVVSANAAAIAPQVNLGGSRTWMIGAIGMLLVSTGFVLGRLIGFIPTLGGPRARTLVFSVGLRNSVSAATLATAYFPEAAALPAILTMIFQQSLAAVYGRLLLGSKTKEKTPPS